MKERSNMAKRRSNGEGTLRLRADGRWEMTIMDGFRDDGKRRFKTFYGKTQKEVKAKAKGYRGAKDSGLLVDVNYLFLEWANIWYELWYVKFRGKQVFRDFLKKCNRMDKNGRFR